MPDKQTKPSALSSSMPSFIVSINPMNIGMRLALASWMAFIWKKLRVPWFKMIFYVSGKKAAACFCFRSKVSACIFEKQKLLQGRLDQNNFLSSFFKSLCNREFIYLKAKFRKYLKLNSFRSSPIILEVVRYLRLARELHFFQGLASTKHYALVGN